MLEAINTVRFSARKTMTRRQNTTNIHPQANGLAKRRQPAQGVEVLKRCVEQIDPLSWSLYDSLGTMQRTLGDDEEACKSYEYSSAAAASSRSSVSPSAETRLAF